MELWQYNAYCEAYQYKQLDTLALQLQAAYMCSYWSGYSKHKRSLESVIDSIYKKKKSLSNTKRTPINVEAESKWFKEMEELRDHGWTKN